MIASAFFASLTGVSVASAAALGTVAIPSQKHLGYDHRMIFGSLAGGGTLAVLIPPSIPMIIYGAMTETSVVKLFIAGIIPGIALTGIFMAYIAIRVWFQPNLVPIDESKHSWQQIIAGLADIVPILLIAFIILLGIFFGVTTPTEAGAIGALCATALNIYYMRSGWWSGFMSALK
jgi:tripartite ATP-independent transporter DctM subunit